MKVELDFYWKESSYDENDEEYIFYKPICGLFCGEIYFGNVRVMHYGKNRGYSLTFESQSLPFIYIPHISVESWEVEVEIVEQYKEKIIELIQSKLVFK